MTGLKLLSTLIEKFNMPKIPVLIVKQGPAGLINIFGFRFFIFSECYLEDERIVAHEVGHYFYDHYQEKLNKLGYGDKFGREGWVSYLFNQYLFNKNKLKKGPEHITEYAAVHHWEDWAELFSHAALNIPITTKNKRLQDKYKFVKHSMAEVVNKNKKKRPSPKNRKRSSTLR